MSVNGKVRETKEKNKELNLTSVKLKRSNDRAKFLAMFRNIYQGGLLSILYSCGSSPLELWDMHVSFFINLSKIWTQNIFTAF